MNDPTPDPSSTVPTATEPSAIAPKERRQLEIVLPLLAAALLCAFGFSALDQYNVTWDEALGDFFFGERYLSFFTSLDPVYLDFLENPYPEDRSPDLSLSPFKGRPWEYYPVANTLAAATSTVLSRSLGLLDPFDGFHAVNLLFAALLVWTLFRFLARRFGLVAAVVGTGLLFGSPRIVVHFLANIKDFPLMALFAVTAFAFFRAYEAGSTRGLYAAGALLGLTLGTKANALFFPAIPALLWLLGGTPPAWRGRGRALFGHLVGAGALSVVTMVAAWPYLWLDPVGHFGEHLRYIAFRKGFTNPDSMAPVLEAILLTTPPVFLAAFAAGLVAAVPRVRRRERPTIFLLVWIAVVLGRYLLPGAVNFDGVRHFLELFPAMAGIAGLGVASALRRLPRVGDSPRLRGAIAGLLLLPGAWAVLLTHPFQIAYWNAFAGGFGGAYASGQPQASDYWGTSYRLGMRWLNENAEEGALVAAPVVEHAVRLVAPVRLRDDLQLLPLTTPFSPRIAPERLRLFVEAASETPTYVMFVERRDWMNPLMLDCLRRLEPAAEWTLDGAPVLRVYRYTPPRPP